MDRAPGHGELPPGVASSNKHYTVAPPTTAVAAAREAFHDSGLEELSAGTFRSTSQKPQPSTQLPDLRSKHQKAARKRWPEPAIDEDKRPPYGCRFLGWGFHIKTALFGVWLLDGS